MNPDFLLRFKKLFCLLYLLALIVPICAIKLAEATAYYNLGALVLGVFMFVILPIVDHTLGKDTANLPADLLEKHITDKYYSFLILLSAPALMALSIYGAHFFSVTPELNWGGRLGWVITLGLCVAALALCPGHELIHRETGAERLIGGFLLAVVGNGFFIIEHIRGHHVDVATPEDCVTARYSQSVYSFLLQAVRKSFAKAWKLEKKRLVRRGVPVLSWRNQMIAWHVVSLSMAIVFYLLFGLWGLVFFLGQGLVVLTAHLIIDYIQHYALLRRKQGEDGYEYFHCGHAWNSCYFFSGMLTFQLPRHGDHHLNPRRRYQCLRYIENSPQMPMGYFGMFLMALIPPLWFKVMNPRVAAYQKGPASPFEVTDSKDSCTRRAAWRRDMGSGSKV